MNPYSNQMVCCYIITGLSTPSISFISRHHLNQSGSWHWRSRSAACSPVHNEAPPINLLSRLHSSQPGGQGRQCTIRYVRQLARLVMLLKCTISSLIPSAVFNRPQYPKTEVFGTLIMYNCKWYLHRGELVVRLARLALIVAEWTMQNGSLRHPFANFFSTLCNDILCQWGTLDL